MVIRDLTLRSAASFGSFHLIRLLYDEYMYYLVEQRVARARGTCPIAVMGEVGVGGHRGGTGGSGQVWGLTWITWGSRSVSHQCHGHRAGF